MKKILKVLSIMAVLTLFVGMQATAQTATYERSKSDYIVYKVVDTLTNADTSTISFPAEHMGAFEYKMQISATELSGTSSATAVLYESCSPNATIYSSTGDSLSISGDTDGVWEGTLASPLMKSEIISSGTQSTEVVAWIVLYKKYDW